MTLHSQIQSTLAISLMLAAGIALGCAERRVPGEQSPSDGALQGKDGGQSRPDGKCVRPPGGCFSTNDCPAGQECKGCGADPCCPMCAVCYGKCVPKSSSTCSDLSKAYGDAIRQAKQCTTADGPKGPQCTLKVAGNLACPCPTFINPANVGPVSALDSLKKAWATGSCPGGPVSCPPCRNPKGAGCVGTSPGNTKGRCQDQY